MQSAEVDCIILLGNNISVFYSIMMKNRKTRHDTDIVPYEIN